MFSSQLCHHTEVQRGGGGGYQAVIDRQSILRKGSRAGFATRNDRYTALALTVRGRVFRHGVHAYDLDILRPAQGVFFPSLQRQKKRIVADSFLVLFNADNENVLLHLGGRGCDLNWELMLSTSASRMESQTLEHLDSYLLKGRSLAVLLPKLPTGTET
jgi:hypothetical protein